MKKLIFLAIAISLFSCNKSVDHKAPKPNGKYKVVDFKMTDQFSKDTLAQKELASALRENEHQFEFNSSKSTINIQSDLGVKFFGDSVFQFTFNEKLLTLKSRNLKVQIPYKREGEIIRLFTDKNGIERFSILPIDAN